MQKQTIIHVHHSHKPISGEMKRIMNINNDVAAILGNTVIEVEFYSLRYYNYVKKEGHFTLSNNVNRKHYIPNLERLGFLNDIWCSLATLYIIAKYQPAYYLEEWKLPRGIQKIKSIFGSKTRIGLDLHGAAPEEFEYSFGKKNRFLDNQEKRSIRQADFIICQSDEMKRHLINKHKFNGNDIAVYRCGVDTTIFRYSSEYRNEIREKLGLHDNEILFVYSGGMHKWQKVSDTLKFYHSFHEKYPRSRLMVLTKDVDELNKIIEVANISEIKSTLIVRSLNYTDVPAYLCAADASFLLRDNVVMNQVASPTKLAEYMACGLPVLSTKVADKWIDIDGKDFVIDIENKSIDEIEYNIRNSSKQAISDYAKTKLSLAVDRNCVQIFFKRNENID